jgi:hypothetical protein
MTIKDWIKELQKYPNQDAELNVIANLVNIDNECFDHHRCNIEFAEQDKDDVAYYDVYVTLNAKDNAKREKNRDESISELLADNEKLTITLDCNDPYSNIVIADENNNCLRDIKVGGNYEQSDNIAVMLNMIIG